VFVAAAEQHRLPRHKKVNAMAPTVELIGNRIRIGPLVLSCDQALAVAHRIHDLLSPSFIDPEKGK
jgi:hypothetical protein